MTITKQHVRPDKTLGKCTAKPGKCRYGTEESHVYYDSSVKKTVLNPTSSEQLALNRLPVDDIDNQKADFLKTSADKAEYDSYFATYQKKAESFEECKQKIISAYPVKEQGFVSQLLNSNTKSTTIIATFKINELPGENDVVRQDDKYEIARKWIAKNDAEAKYRSVVSSYFAAKSS